MQPDWMAQIDEQRFWYLANWSEGSQTAECLNQVRISTLSVRPTISMTKFTMISRQRRAHTSVSSFCLLMSILPEAIAQVPIPGDSFTGTVQKLEAVGAKIQMRDGKPYRVSFRGTSADSKDVRPVINLKQLGSIDLTGCQISDGDLAALDADLTHRDVKDLPGYLCHDDATQFCVSSHACSASTHWSCTGSITCLNETEKRFMSNGQTRRQSPSPTP